MPVSIVESGFLKTPSFSYSVYHKKLMSMIVTYTDVGIGVGKQRVMICHLKIFVD